MAKASLWAPENLLVSYLGPPVTLHASLPASTHVSPERSEGRKAKTYESMSGANIHHRPHVSFQSGHRGCVPLLPSCLTPNTKGSLSGGGTTLPPPAWPQGDEGTWGHGGAEPLPPRGPRRGLPLRVIGSFSRPAEAPALGLEGDQTQQPKAFRAVDKLSFRSRSLNDRKPNQSLTLGPGPPCWNPASIIYTGHYLG